jgi:hypothetical protein
MIEEHHRRQGDLVVLQRDQRCPLPGRSQPTVELEVPKSMPHGTGWRGVFHVFRFRSKKRPRSVCQSATDSKADHLLFHD